MSCGFVARMARRGARMVGVGLAGLIVGTALHAHAQSSVFTIVIKDGKFVPNEIVVPAGQKVKLIVRNEEKSTSEFESTDLHREQMVLPGGEIRVYVGPLDPGTYDFFDDFHPADRGRLIAK